MGEVLRSAFETQAKALREFGYPNTTADAVRIAHEKWISGKPPEGIIEMFCMSAFEDHPAIFGRRDNG